LRGGKLFFALPEGFQVLDKEKRRRILRITRNEENERRREREKTRTREDENERRREREKTRTRNTITTVRTYHVL
jgi:hypothetical protein